MREHARHCILIATHEGQCGVDEMADEHQECEEEIRRLRRLLAEAREQIEALRIDSQGRR